MKDTLIQEIKAGIKKSGMCKIAKCAFLSA